jgi:hypothetical protein
MCLVLKDITLSDLKYCSDPERSNLHHAVSRVARTVPRLLQQLPLLSMLQLPGFPFTDAAAQQTAGMTRLQQLHIAHAEDMDPSDLDHLPSSITQLHLNGNSGPHSEPDLPLEWPQLSGLLELELYKCAVYPMVLGELTQLQQLQMVGCHLLPTPLDDTYQTEATAALLEVLPSLTRLQKLYLDLDRLDIESITPQQFSALTASSQLTMLNLIRDDDPVLPKGALQHMFPPSRRMQLLQPLAIGAYLSQDTFFMPSGWCLDSAD